MDQVYSRCSLYILSFDPHVTGSYDIPHLTDEETEAQIDDFAQGHKASQWQS